MNNCFVYVSLKVSGSEELCVLWFRFSLNGFSSHMMTSWVLISNIFSVKSKERAGGVRTRLEQVFYI